MSPAAHLPVLAVQSRRKPAVAPPTDAVGAQPLIGRVAELRAIDRALAELAAGHPGVLEVTGDPGIGKSRLLAEVRSRARAAGLLTLTAGPSSGPFGVLADAFADCFERWPGRTPPAPETLDAWCAVLGGPAAGGAALWRTGPTVDRATFARTLRQLLSQLATDGLVLVIDDLHGADPDSLDVVDQLIRRPPAAPLLLAVGYRSRQADPALRAGLAAGRERGHVHTLALPPLTPGQTAELIGAERPGLSDSDLATLTSAAEGNPLYAGIVARRGIVDSTVDPATGTPEPPDHHLLAEVDALTASELTAAAAGAVIGAEFDADLLGAVCDLDRARTRAALDTLIRHDIVRAAHTGPVLRFRHPLLWQAVYARAHPTWRLAAHRRALAALSAAGATAPVRARHVACSTSTWSAEDGSVLLEAAACSLATDPDAAMGWLRTLLALMPRSAELAGHRFEVTLELAGAARAAGRLGLARDLLHDLVVDPAPVNRHLHPTVVARCAEVECRLGRYAEAKALLRREIGHLPSGGGNGADALHRELAMVALATGDPEAAGTHARAGARGFTTAAPDGTGGHDVEVLRAQVVLAYCEAVTGSAADSTDPAGVAALIVDGMSDGALVHEIDALVTLGWAELWLERLPDARRHLYRAETVARRAGRRYALAQSLLGLSQLHAMTGPLDAAVTYATQAASAARDTGADDLVTWARMLRTAALLIAGRAEEGRDAMRTAWQTAPVPYRSALPCWDAVAGFAVAHPLRDGTYDDLAAPQGTDVDLAGEGFVAGHGVYHHIAAAHAALAVGEPTPALRHADTAVDLATTSGRPGQRGQAWHARAAALAACGDYPGAVEALHTARAHFAAAGIRVGLARVDLDLGVALRGCGRDREAQAALVRAGESGTGAGLRQVCAEVARRRNEAGASSRYPRDIFAVLTEREREVAFLVGVCATSREIAHRLHLSPRTVDTHLTRIYRKLDVPSRSALARLAERTRQVADQLNPRFTAS